MKGPRGSSGTSLHNGSRNPSGGALFTLRMRLSPTDVGLKVFWWLMSKQDASLQNLSIIHWDQRGRWTVLLGITCGSDGSLQPSFGRVYLGDLESFRAAVEEGHLHGVYMFQALGNDGSLRHTSRRFLSTSSCPNHTNSSFVSNLFPAADDGNSEWNRRRKHSSEYLLF